VATFTLDSQERRAILKGVASGERNVACDVVARIALDEINELERLLKEYRSNPMSKLTTSDIRKVTG